MINFMSILRWVLVFIPKPLVLIETMNKKDECSLDGVQLLKIIARKKEDEEAAAKAFRLFVEVFESKINKQVDIIANKNGYDEKVAFEAIQCAFNKVWLYPTFDMNKSYYKDQEKAIVVWLIRIAVSQMYQFARHGVCAQIKSDEDLSVIENAEDFVDSFHLSYLTHIAVTRHVTPWFPISRFFEVWFGCSMDFLFPSGLGLM